MFHTAPDLTDPLQSALTRHRRLPWAATEVLVVVALHQPATRPEIEVIRSVGVGQATMDLLTETELITSHGRKQVPGTLTLRVTTPRFLAQFGLRSLREIPGAFPTGTIPVGGPGGQRAAAEAGDTGSIGNDRTKPKRQQTTMTQPHVDPAPTDSAVACRTCGACCVTGDEVAVDAADLTPRHLTRSVRGRVGFASCEAAELRRLRRIDGHCAAFRGEVGAASRCVTYARHPAVCLEFRPGSVASPRARADAGLPPP